MNKNSYLLVCHIRQDCLFIQGQRERSPHTNKLRTRVTNICGYRRRQPNRSAMGGPLPGGTAFMITVSPVPGKYA